MARRLADINKEIESESGSFRLFLENTLDRETNGLLGHLSKKCSVYIFSGIIRNYFLGVQETRDIDIVVDGEVEIEAFIQSFPFRKNQFGGFKVMLEKTEIDIWHLKDTWALKHSQFTMEFELDKYIPRTAFFNFSSVLFFYNQNRFIYTKYFSRFLRDKQIDLVFAPNANKPLCVVNTIYYAEKYKLRISEKLASYIKTAYHSCHDNLDEVQLNHFGKVLYSKKNLQEKLSHL